MAENQGALERGHVKGNLIRDLAAGELSQVKLGDRYGVSSQAVSQFAARHAAEIERTRARIGDQFAALWAADKFNRVAEYQQQAEDVAELDEASAEFMRLKQTALRSIAEELGQLPTRTVHHTGGVSVRYEVAGLDPEALR